MRHVNWKLTAALSVIFMAAPAAGEQLNDLGVACLLLDGTSINVRSLAITGDRVTGVGAPADLTLDDLQRISPPDIDDVPTTNAIAIVELRGGGRLWSAKFSLADEKAHIEWPGGQPLVVPVDLLRGIRLDLETDRGEFDKSLATPAAELDRLFIKNDRDLLDSVTGLVESLNADQLKIDVSGQIRSVPRAKIHGVVFAQPIATSASPRLMVQFRDGSRLGGEKLSLSNGNATLSLNKQTEVKFDWSNVQRVKIRSSRMTYLSDLTPIKEVQTPIVTLPLPAQRDKSVSGGLLTVGVQSFEKGLGVHSRSALTFATAGNWDVFTAQIGLDAESHDKGDCIFHVLADGNSIFERRINRQDLIAVGIELPITGCRELTLLVEPGVNLDLADHANWCDARLIKNK